MSKTFFFKIALSLFLFAILFAAAVSAQTNSCAIKMEVLRSESAAVIKGASATAVNDKTKKAYRSVLKNGMPYFAKLPEGDYRVTVTRAGYMRSADDFYLDCNDIYDWTIELYNGSPKQLVKIYDRPDPLVEAPVNPPRRLDVKTIPIEPNTNTTDQRTGETTSPQSIPKTVSGGVVNNKATNLVKPEYPAAARAARASGAVNVQVTIDENGKVISASAVSGHPLLRQAAVDAAKASTFSPTLLAGQPVKVTGVIVYNFIAP